MFYAAELKAELGRVLLPAEFELPRCSDNAGHTFPGVQTARCSDPLLGLRWL